ncbi:MAG: hypothetical protein ACI4GE_05925 [Lachnospiraceae bacterium]
MENTLDELKKMEIAKESKNINKKFMQDTKSDDILIIILKAHLYMERELTKTLTDTIIDEKVLRATTFRQKLDLAKSMGLLDEHYGALGKVNSIRNSFAHSIDYKFDEKTYEDLLSTLPKIDKDDFLTEYEMWRDMLYDKTIPEFNFKLQLLLNNIWFALVSCHATAKKAIELRLREKEIETISRCQKAESLE